MPVSAWENGKGWKCYQDGFCVSAGSMRSAFPFPFFFHSLSWVLCVALSILQSDLHALYCVFHCNPIECFVLCPPFSIVLISGRTSRKISLPQSIHPSRPPSRPPSRLRHIEGLLDEVVGQLPVHARHTRHTGRPAKGSGAGEVGAGGGRRAGGGGGA